MTLCGLNNLVIFINILEGSLGSDGFSVLINHVKIYYFSASSEVKSTHLYGVPALLYLTFLSTVSFALFCSP